MIGVDSDKRVLRLHAVDVRTGEIRRWSRRFTAMRHEARLIATKFMHSFVKTNNADVADAAAILQVTQRPGMRFVPIMREQQQRIMASRGIALHDKPDQGLQPCLHAGTHGSNLQNGGVQIMSRTFRPSARPKPT